MCPWTCHSGRDYGWKWYWARKMESMFKTAVSLEETGKMEIVALDKTGTITSGEPQVTDIVPANGMSQDESELLVLAFTFWRQKSEHPLAKAITGRVESEVEQS